MRQFAGSGRYPAVRAESCRWYDRRRGTMPRYDYYGSHNAILFASGILRQTPTGVDFARDVAPLFRRNCVGCHGAAQQQSGIRLDRKSSVVRPFSRRVVPGCSANSFTYLRIAGLEFGIRMPPTGPMRPDEIAVVEAWIDQGAGWPDSLANEVELPPLNPKAIAMVESLRTGDMAAFMKSAAADPTLLNARGPEGSTPFMYAVLYAGAPALARMLKLGADPNKHNDAHATALM